MKKHDRFGGAPHFSKQQIFNKGLHACFTKFTKSLLLFCYTVV